MKIIPVVSDTYRKKVEDVKRINFQGARIIDIDAEQPYKEEILQIKRIIWKEVL